MLIIDFEKLTIERANMTLQEVGVVDFKHLPLLIILESLELGSNKMSQEYFPIHKKSGVVDIRDNIRELRLSKRVSDVIGPLRIPRGTPVCFSTFVSLHPKAYIKQYIDIGYTLCTKETGLIFTVWLEDTIPAFKNRWDRKTTNEAVKAYQIRFAEEAQEYLLVSSEVIPHGIPRSFAEEKFSNISGEEFLSVMPFHLRQPRFVRILDIIHFAWNCYVIYRYPGVYLAGISNKRHFQLFRKVIGKDFTVLLVPLFPE
jgi:hypothetical protein